MSNEEEISNNILEIRVYLIGDYNVGKKSIIKRFKTLNSSKTTGDITNKPKKNEKYKINNNSENLDNKEESRKGIKSRTKRFFKKRRNSSKFIEIN